MKTISEVFKDNGVSTIFTYAGGTIAYLLDAFVKQGVKVITARHEQAAAIMASAYSKAGLGIGVCMATSGPGVTNLITGIADAYYDHTPMIIITGQVDVKYIQSSNQRQNGFQQLETLKLTKSITVYNAGLYDENYEVIINKAFKQAVGCKGPSLLDVPIDIQRSYA